MLRYLLLGLALFLSALTPAQAADTPPVTTLLGAGARTEPAYDGSDTSQLALIPVIRYYGQPWFMRSTFGMLEGGLRNEVFSGLTLGVQLAYEDGRNSKDAAFLSTHNLPTLHPSLSWGVHIELEKYAGPMPLIALLRYRQDIDSKRGTQTDLRLTAGIYSDNGINAGIFAQTTWADQTSANYYYGITPQQAASSSLPAYDGQSGTLFNAYGLLWSYDINPQWMLLGSVETRHVQSAVSNSPLLQQSGSSYISLGLAYQL